VRSHVSVVDVYLAQENCVARVFKPGDQVPSSGIYKVSHDGPHRTEHYVTALAGEVFPQCVECAMLVRFEAAASAVYVAVHPHFSRKRPRD